MLRILLVVLTSLPLLLSTTRAAESVDTSLLGAAVPLEKVRNAIQRAIPTLEAGAVGSARERTCFTCHSQALPVLALVAARRCGCEIDADVLHQQLEHTWKHLNRGKAGYLEGNGQGGQVMTAGYAMWTLEVGGWPADETTAAVNHYLIRRHRDRKHWSGGGRRPPSSGSAFTSTYVALRALDYYGTDDQQSEIRARRDDAAQWLVTTQPRDIEDRVFQLRSLAYIGADRLRIQSAVDGLLALQAEDGGWAQTDQLQSDAYATGSVMSALQEVAALPSQHPAMLAGCNFLLESQLPDGTWHVTTRADPIQDYFESDFPHGEDQFISIAATGWAVVALAGMLPQTTKTASQETPHILVKHCDDFELNGLGDAAAWDTTEWVALNRRPMAQHTYESRIKTLYSDSGIYVLFDGSDQKLTATLQADFLDLWNEDVYECFLWPDESTPLYFEYEISPLGYELPILIPNLKGRFLGWRPWHYEGPRKIRKQVSIREGTQTPMSAATGWRAEVFIPFELLTPLENVPPKSGTKWRANFYRVDYDDQQVTQWDWSRVGNSFHEFRKFGTLEFE